MLGLQLIWVVQIREDAEAILVALLHASVARENRHHSLVVHKSFIPALFTPLQQVRMDTPRKVDIGPRIYQQ